jgi:hypothetical protein
MLSQREKGLIRALMYPVQFDRNPSDSDNVERVLRLVIQNGSLNADEEEYLSAIQNALSSKEKLTALVPGIKRESKVRDFLRRVGEELGHAELREATL